jgi:hypothetical protein
MSGNKELEKELTEAEYLHLFNSLDLASASFVFRHFKRRRKERRLSWADISFTARGNSSEKVQDLASAGTER